MKTTDLTLQTKTITETAVSLSIKSVKDARLATEWLSKANKTLDALTAEEERITKPAQEVIRNERQRWAPMKKNLKETIELLRTKLSTYQTKALAQSQAKAAKIAEQASDGSLDIETAVRKLATLGTPDDEIETENGSLSFRSKQTLKIIDVQLIPRAYLIPDEELLLDTLKSGKKVPGTAIEVIQVPVNRRAL